MSMHLWLTYFTLNATASRGIRWETEADLPQGEAAWLIPSLQEFQLGESSAGARLRKAAAAFERRHPHPAFLEVIEQFISEEQRHAAELARWLRIQGRPVIQRTAGDAAFRALRRVTGSLEVSLSVLMTAEIIGYVYYGAVRAATGSASLRDLCDALLRDEAAHLVFHMDTLSALRAGRRLPGRWATRLASRALLESACVAAWRRHSPVLRRAGMSWSAFRSRCLARLDLALRPLGRERRRPRWGIALPHGW